MLCGSGPPFAGRASASGDRTRREAARRPGGRHGVHLHGAASRVAVGRRRRAGRRGRRPGRSARQSDTRAATRSAPRPVCSTFINLYYGGKKALHVLIAFALFLEPLTGETRPHRIERSSLPSLRRCRDHELLHECGATPNSTTGGGGAPTDAMKDGSCHSQRRLRVLRRQQAETALAYQTVLREFVIG